MQICQVAKTLSYFLIVKVMQNNRPFYLSLFLKSRRKTVDRNENHKNQFCHKSCRCKGQIQSDSLPVAFKTIVIGSHFTWAFNGFTICCCRFQSASLSSRNVVCKKLKTPQSAQKRQLTYSIC